MKTRVAIIGFGRWGRFCHAALIGQTPNLELAGIASGSEEKRAQIESEFGVHAFENLDAVLADDSIEAVVLATPNDTHFPFAMRALEAGKHVVCDKPLCLSLAQCDEMLAAAQKGANLLTTFQNRRRDGDFLTLQKLLNDGELGDLRWLEMAWQNFGIWGGWRAKREHGGGKFLDLGAHLIDQALLLIPHRVTSVFLRVHYDVPESEVESESFLVLGFSNGATAVCDTSSLAAISKPRFYARGTKATWQKFGLDPQEAALKDGDINQARENEDFYGILKSRDGEKIVPTLPGRWRDFYENFALAVEGKAELLAPPQDTRRVMAIFEAAWQSAREDQVVKTEI